MTTEDQTIGRSFVRKVPDGDNEQRLVCEDCGFIHYENPKVVVGAVATWEDKILLCRRAINPRKGFWTIPAGYLELHESADEGAKREAWEEAHARIDIIQLLAVYSIPRISQIQLIYSARLITPAVTPGVETLELDLFDWDDIPWDELAFPSVEWALNHHRDVGDTPHFAPRSNPPDATGDMPR